MNLTNQRRSDNFQDRGRGEAPGLIFSSISSTPIAINPELEEALNRFRTVGIPVAQMEMQTRNLVRFIAEELDQKDKIEDHRIAKDSILEYLNQFPDNTTAVNIHQMIEALPVTTISTSQFTSILNTVIESGLNQVRGDDWNVTQQELGNLRSSFPELLNDALHRLR